MRTATFLFFIIPLVEMIILIEVGGMIGPLPTVGLVVLTAICGVWLLRLEGIATLTRVQEKLQRGEIPESELLEGIMLIIGGALLLTPGFATDIVGFVCLVPGLRRPLAARIIRSTSFGQFQMHRPFQGGGFRNTDDQPGQTIEGEFVSESNDEAPATKANLENPDKPL
ncbi:MAG: FxsA family protein [Pseudomonadales bacterium]|nr:FxsA family protein [Pseudomonadales bacterium]